MLRKLLLLSFLLSPVSHLIAQMPETDIWVFKMLLPSSNDPQLKYQFAEGTNITNRPGYDNQPWFTPDNKTMYWTSVRDSGETDIYSYNFKSKQTTRVTNTNISEYSPQFIPGTKFMTCVVVEQDSTQRLWKYDESSIGSMHAKTEILFPELKGVAYHRWLDADHVFIADLPEPMTLYIGNIKTGELKKVETNVGRSFSPFGTMMFYTWSDTDNLYIRSRDQNGTDTTTSVVTPCFGNSQDFVLYQGYFFMADGTKLYARKLSGGDWILQHDFATEGLHRITRIAISPDGTHIALTDNL